MKNYLFIYNPKSGNHQITQNLNKVNTILMEKNILLTHLPLDSQKDVFTLVSGHFLKRFDALIVSGGDGSVNLGVNILHRNKVDIPLGIIPTGTCNDFANNIGISTNIEKAAEIIAQGKKVRVDVGTINDEECFINSFAGGQLINAAFTTDNNLKKNFGVGAYYLNVFQQVVELKFHDLRVIANQRTYNGRYLLFSISSGKQLGSMVNLVPKADMNDGKFELLLIKECNKLELFQSLMDALGNGVYNNRNINIIKSSNFTIESNEEISTTVDGERGVALPVKIDVLKGYIEVFAQKE